MNPWEIVGIVVGSITGLALLSWLLWVACIVVFVKWFMSWF